MRKVDPVARAAVEVKLIEAGREIERWLSARLGRP